MTPRPGPGELARVRALEILPSVIGPGLPHDEALPVLAALAAAGLGAIPARRVAQLADDAR